MENICPVCGSSFEGSKRQRKCQKCRYIRPPREYTCIDCGATFTSTGYHVKRCPSCAAAEKKQVVALIAQAELQEDRESAAARKLADENYVKTCQLFRSGYTRKEIGRLLRLSRDKVNKILVDAGLISYPETELFNAGLTVAEISEATGTSRKLILSRIPYAFTPYDATYPSRSADRTRRCRARKKEKGPES